MSKRPNTINRFQYGFHEQCPPENRVKTFTGSGLLKQCVCPHLCTVPNKSLTKSNTYDKVFNRFISWLFYGGVHNVFSVFDNILSVKGINPIKFQPQVIYYNTPLNLALWQ